MTAATGVVAPRGGFDSILTLFDGTGLFITDNDEGTGVGVDPLTGTAADARITIDLAAGRYIVALTQFDNFASGFYLADGFVQTGFPNFTADPAFTSGDPCAGDLFRDISATPGRCRSGKWTVDFSNVGNATVVPEPSSLILLGVSVGGLLLASRIRRRAAAQRLLGCLAMAVYGGTVQAQNSGPDYTKVRDFLSGQRSLLKITDLQVAAYNLNRGDTWLTSVNTSNSQQSTQPQIQLRTFANDAPIFCFAVRMFNQQKATTFTTVHHANQRDDFWLLRNDGLPWLPLGGNDDPLVTGGVAADFTLDGFEDLAVGFDDGRIVVGTPNDINDQQGGYRQAVASLDVLKGMTAGDFNGDGRREIAGLSVTASGGLNLVIYSVDPATLAITRASSLLLTTPYANAGNPITHASIARGRFNSPDSDQLVVAFATDMGLQYVEIIDFTPNTLTPLESPAGVPSSVPISAGFIQVKTGKFALPGNPYDQVVYLSASPVSGGRFFAVISVDPASLKIKVNTPVSYDQYPCAYGVEVGNFDNRQADPLNPGQTEHNPNAQIAFLAGGCGSAADKFINLYSADQASFALTYLNGNVLPDLKGDTSPPRLFLVAADLQGRSLSLGEPTVISIDSARQPSVVIGVPPMHVDFVSPDPLNKVPPRVLNLSAVPEGFKTTYDQQTSTGVQSSTSHKSSWSFGSEESGTASVTVGDPKTNGLKVKDTISAAQKLKGASETAHGAFTSKTFDLSATTGFGDEVSYADSQFNIWVYPVIGQRVCPQAKPACEPNEQVPATMQFSAPTGDPAPQALQGQALQWYQPLWEPGNIFRIPLMYSSCKACTRT